MIFVVVTIFIIGIILFFSNHLNKQIYDSLDNYMEDSDYNGTEAHQTVEKLQTIEGSNTWDYAFLAIFIGLILQMLLFSFATRISVAFYWIFAIIGIIILVVGTILSNIWQSISASGQFAETILRFPITNLILGSYYPMFCLAILFFAIIILFGKPPRESLE